MTKFRFHRGTLADSLATTVEVKDRAALVEYIRANFLPYELSGDTPELKVRYYAFDKRIDEHTYIVADSVGVVGFTDGPI